MAQPRNSTADQLERVTPDLDELIRDARLGARDQRHFDQLEERAQRIAAAIIAAFRAPTRQAPSSPPLLMTKTGAWF